MAQSLGGRIIGFYLPIRSETEYFSINAPPTKNIKQENQHNYFNIKKIQPAHKTIFIFYQQQ